MRVNLLIAAVAAVFMVTGVSVQDAAAKPSTVKKSPVTKKAPTKKGLSGVTAPGKRDVKKGITKGVKPVAKKPGFKKPHTSGALTAGGVKPMAKPAATIGKPALKPKARPSLHGAAAKPAHKPMVKEGHPAARRPSLKPAGDRPDAKKAARPGDKRPMVNKADLAKKAFPRKAATK